MDTVTLITIIAAVILAILVILVLRYLSQTVWNTEGKNADTRTTRTLRRFAGIRRFRVLSHITLGEGEKAVQIENMLIGFFGILLVHTLGGCGEYYGSLDGDEWVRTLNAVRHPFPNPLKQQQRAAVKLRELLTKNKVRGMPIEHYVYLTNTSKKTALFISHNGEILQPGKLGRLLGKTRYEEDKGFDVELIARIIRENSSTGA